MSIFHPESALRVRLLASIFVLSCYVSAGFGQSTAPTTRPAHVVTVPPGFVTVEAGRVRVMCQPADEALVKQALSSLTPTTRPTTLPVDLLKNLSENRAELVRVMTSDLALPDDTKATKFLDERLTPILQRLESIDHRSPLVYVYMKREVLIDLLKSGQWSDPALYYNRVANDVAFDLALNINPERDLEQTVVPILSKPEEDDAARAERIRQLVQKSDSELTRYVSTSGTLAVYLSFVRFVGDEVVRPLKLKLDQDWLGMGVIGNLSAKYASVVTNIPRGQMIDATTSENPRAPVKADSVDLLHPTSPADLNPRYARPYIDAAGRKATLVVRSWVEKTSDESITKILVSLKAEPAPDGPALVKRIKDLTGVDLTSELGPR